MKAYPGIAACILLLTGCESKTPSTNDGGSEAAQAAASGIAEVVKSAAKGNPIPRENLPDFLETYEGGRYGTSFFGSNEKHKSGTLLYTVAATPADVAAFHDASMKKLGFDVAAPKKRVVRDRNETVIEGKAGDGRELSVIVIEQSPAEATVQMNYVVPLS